MFLSKSPSNVRCDTINCHNFSAYTLSTSTYKGSLNLCPCCAKQLEQAIKSLKSQEKNKEKK